MTGDATAPPVRVSRPRALVVDARVITPDRDGGSLRLSHILRMFRRHGLDVRFAPSFPHSFPPFCDTLARDAARMREDGIELVGDGSSLEEHLQAHGGEYALAWVCGAYVAARHAPAIRRLAPQAALVFDTIDLHHVREFREARLTGSVLRLRNALKVKRAELAVARSADCAVVVSETERRILLREAPGTATAVVPNVHEVVRAVPGFAARRDLLFLGAFTFSPNVDAVLSFVREILPAVRTRLPGVRLVVAGADPTAEVRALAGADVEVTGYVADLSPLFGRCRVVVAPLRFGAGIKGKLLFAMGQGVPAVASPVAVEGIPATPGEDVLVAGTAGDWVERIAALYEDAGRWRRQSDAGRRLVEEHFSVAGVEARVGRLVDGLLEGRKPAAAAREEGGP